MKKAYLVILFLFIAGVVSAQEKLSKEEKARREKNIEAGNPFKQFGYKAKVATLSKGKYLEVHDLDSVVTIGSIRFHVDKKEIVGIAQADTVNGLYARPIGDMPSRWLSPDPLSEEFTSWSPYNFSFNSPLRFNDPTGLGPEDVIINGPLKNEAFKQLQASSQNLNLVMDDNGKVTATAKEGATLSAGEQTLQAATTDKNITVNINTTTENTVVASDGSIKTFDGGAFMGSTVNADNTVTANQTVNPETAAKLDKASGQGKGIVILHETIEAYVGAQQNPGAGDAIASPAAYQQAHGTVNEILKGRQNPAGAIQQSKNVNGVIHRISTDRKGNVTPLYQVKPKR